MNAVEPCIKGIFVKSHINALKREKGEEGLLLFESRYGKKLEISNNDNIPLAEELKIIEYVFDILNPGKYNREEKSFETGRMHFRNFVTTPLAKIIFPVFKNSFKKIMLNVSSLAGHIFKGIQFISKEEGPKSVKITLTNYKESPQHVMGLFYEWMLYSGLEGTVKYIESESETCVFLLTWK